MINLIKGILYRMVNNKDFLIMPLIITPIVIAAAMFFSSSFVTKANVGVIGDGEVNFNNDEINVIKLQNNVPMSDLVKNKYDAVISYENGKAIVQTIKDNNLKDKIERLVNGENISIKDNGKRGVVSNIIGYITMFILMFGVKLYKFFFDEKKGIANRIISANISYEKYVLGHCISVFIMLSFPIVIITILCKEVFHINTNVTDLEMVFIVLVLSFLASTFGLLIASITKDLDSASMFGTIISIITTLFAGSFFTITNNYWINKIGDIMPQKHILDFTISLENNSIMNYNNILIVFLISFLMIISSLKIKKYTP